MAVECAGILVLRERRRRGGLSVLAGSGCYRDYARRGATPAARARSCAQLIHEAFDQPRPRFLASGATLLYIGTGSGRELVALMDADKRAVRHRQGAGRGVLQPPRRRLRQRHALRAARARQPASWRRRSRAAPPQLDGRQGAAGEPERAAADAPTPSRARCSARSRTI